MKGIINLETMIVLLAYFALIGLLVNSLANANEKLETKKDLLSAKSSVLRCSIIINSVYSNSGGEVELKENCFFDKGKIKSKKGKETSEEKTLTEKVSSGKNKIEIGVEEHYK